MGFVEYNLNPEQKMVGDCTVRAIATAMGQGWEKTYMDLALEGFCQHDMPSANAVWGAYLKKNGWKRHTLPDSCPDCYTVRDFCKEHEKGSYILALPSHVVCVKDGDWLDTWDSAEGNPLYYWTKGE